MKEQVNHPSHYNSHPAGIECIEVIRHYACDIANALKYLWRAGLKVEMGKDDAEKEMEDLHKAMWYVEDFLHNYKGEMVMMQNCSDDKINARIQYATGHTPEQISEGYENNVASAIRSLLQVGLVCNGLLYNNHMATAVLLGATDRIQARIDDIRLNIIRKQKQL